MEKPNFVWGSMIPIFRIFGSNCFIENDCNNGFKVSRKWQSYSGFIIFILVLCNILLAYTALPNIKQHQSLAIFFGLADLFSYGLSCVCGNAYILLKTSSFSSLINEIVRIKRELWRSRFCSRHQLTLFRILFSVFVSESIYGIVFFLIHIFSYDFESLITRVLYFFMNGVLLSLEFSYVIYVFNVKYLIEWINVGASQLQIAFNYDRILKKLGTPEKNQLKCLKQVKFLRYIHLKCSDVAEVVDKNFSIINLVNISSDFVGLVYSFYWNFTNQKEIGIGYLATLFWTSFFMIKLFLKLDVSAKTMLQVNTVY